MSCRDCEFDSSISDERSLRTWQRANLDCTERRLRTRQRANFDCELRGVGREEGIGGQSTFVDHAGSGSENAIRSTRITTGGLVSCLSQVTRACVLFLFLLHFFVVSFFANSFFRGKPAKYFLDLGKKTLAPERVRVLRFVFLTSCDWLTDWLTDRLPASLESSLVWVSVSEEFVFSLRGFDELFLFFFWVLNLTRFSICWCVLDSGSSCCWILVLAGPALFGGVLWKA
jgi:hypothetical protein